MVRWADIPVGLQANMKKRTAPFEQTPWVEAPNLHEARIAIITTAAIHRADDRPFTGQNYCGRKRLYTEASVARHALVIFGPAFFFWHETE
jgi:hypothetical protein